MSQQKLITAAIARKIPKLYAQEKVKDPIVYIKFFNPCGEQTWYITEYDGDDTFFGYVDLGMGSGYAELGYISRSELESLRLPYGLHIERDIHWSPTPLSQIR